MGFGTELQGKPSHEALLRLHDTEIRLLENFKRCLSVRIDSDKKYAASLSSLVQQAQKLDYSEFLPNCAVFKAWDNIVQQTDAFIKILKSNVEALMSSTMDSLNDLISKKKAAKKYYESERQKLDSEFSRVQSDIQDNRQDYTKCLQRVNLDHAKYQDMKAKGKIGAKLEDARSKFLRSSEKLHQIHNNYVLSLREARSHQTCYLTQTLPMFLDCQQSSQETLVYHWKHILQEYFRLTNYTREDYLKVFQSMESSIDEIIPENEFTDAFIQQCKSDPIETSKFEFDCGLIEDINKNLKSDQLCVDQYTEGILHIRMDKIKEEIPDLERIIKEKEDQLQLLEDELKSVKSGKKEFNETNLEKKKDLDAMIYDITIIKGNVTVQKELSGVIKSHLDSAPNPLPCVVELEEDKSSIDTSTSSIPAAATGLKKLKKLTHLFGPKDKEDVKEAEKSYGYEDQEVSKNGPTEKTKAQVFRDSNRQPVPLEEEEWFHGVLPREEVQRLLAEDGDFLVRESKNRKTNETQYVLSAKWDGYKHFIIQCSEEGWRFEGASFSTIQELVDYQYKSGLEVTTKSKAILKKPILRERWQLRNDDIALEMKIGNGNFGEVYRGIYKPNNQVVAVKTCRDTLSEDQRKKFLMEGRILKQYDHPHIVKFIGIAAQRQPVMIVMEFVPGGALLTFLRKQGRLKTAKQLVQMSENAASGMAYLEGKNCIHRDLAARNCLVGEQNVVKISDFGMSREEEEYTVSEGMKQIPIKWTAPEALMYGKYTSLCDVWSFGILMWEIFSGGMTPYAGMSNSKARESVETGYRMPAPENTPGPVYQLMMKCWDFNPNKRPHFDEIWKELQQILKTL